MPRIRLAALIILLLAGVVTAADSPGAAQQQPAQSSGAKGDGAQQDPGAVPPTFRGEIDFIRVDAFVTDRSGKPVMDLKETDFEITEDGKPRKIEQFKVIRIEGTPVPPDSEPVRRIRSSDDEEAEARRDDVRLFVFFLDDYHVRDRNAVAMRRTLTEFIETQLGPLDMVALMYPLTPASDVSFSRNRQSLISAINRFEGRKYNYVARNQIEREVERETPETIEKVRNQIVYSALEALTYRLGGLREGRKSVIFVSEGFSTYLPPQIRRIPALGPAAADSDPDIERRIREQSEMELENRMKEVYRAAGRNNTAFYPLDPRGLAVFEFDINDGGAAVAPVDLGSDAATLKSTQETLRSLAVETGGRAIINRNTLNEGLAEMISDSSYYYLLGYTTQAPTDGKYHDIKVRVKRGGLEVRARKGFWAYTNEDIKRLMSPKAPVDKPLQQALSTLASPVTAARYVRTWIGTERGENGRTRITLVWEPLPIQPNVRREQAGRVSLLAIDGQGAQVFRGRSPEGPAAFTTSPPAAATPANAFAAQRLAFDAPPGKLELKLTIEAAAGGTLDDETRTVDVPDLTAAQVKLSTPRVFRSRNAREFQAVAADASAVPIAAREFSRTERLLIRFDVYGPGDEKPLPVAVVINPAGQKLADLTVAPAASGGTHQIDLPLNTMAPGQYVVQITVKDATGADARELVALRIGA